MLVKQKVSFLSQSNNQKCIKYNATTAEVCAKSFADNPEARMIPSNYHGDILFKGKDKNAPFDGILKFFKETFDDFSGEADF
ncbi:MAG: hypothetical protein AB1782_09505 [Cyanobacteriota bacterium]